MAVNIAELTHNPIVLYQASIERMSEAHSAMRSENWAVGMYLSGLAVECVLQAIALFYDASYDAQHDLSRWLSKCPTGLQDSLKSRVSRAH